MTNLTRRPPAWATVGALAFAGLCSAFMFTLVVPLQGELPRLLDTSPEAAAWVVTITLLVGAIATPISGRLGDMFGKRRVVLVLVVMLLIGSLIAALSDSLVGMIVGRGFQGLTTGVIPLGIAIMRDVLPPARLGTAVALMSATMGVGGAVGMPLAAYIAEHFDWHTLFWMSGGLGVIGIIGVLFLVPGDTLLAGGRIDIWGAFGLAVSLSGLLLYVSQGAVWGWGSPLALGVLAVGVLALAVWFVYQLRARDPLVDLRVAARPAVLLTNLASIGMGFALFASNVTFPQILELPTDTGTGFGLDMFQAAMCIMPSGVVMILLSPLSGYLERVFGPRPLFSIGTSLVVVSYVFVLLWSSEVWHIVVASTIIGFGIAFSFAAMPMIIMRSVPSNETGVSNGLNALFRSVGTSSASAVMGGVLAAMSVKLGDHSFPTAAAFQTCFWIAIAAAIVATALTFFIPRKGPAEETHPSIPEGVA